MKGEYISKTSIKTNATGTTGTEQNEKKGSYKP